MEDRYKFVGAGSEDPEFREEVSGQIDSMRESAIENRRGSLEKNELELRMGKFAVWCVNNEAKELGEPNQELHSVDQILIYEHGNQVPLGYVGNVSVVLKIIRFGRFEYDQRFLLVNLIHEGLHVISDTVYKITETKEGFVKPLEFAKSGFVIDTLGIEFFYGFNEAVYGKWTLELMHKHLNTISDILNYQPQELESLMSDFMKRYYTEKIEILDIIIAQIAMKKNITENEVWIDLKKTCIGGGFEFYSELQDIFGLDALDLLAAWDSGGIKEYLINDTRSIDRLLRRKGMALTPEFVNAQIKRFLTTSNNEEKKMIANLLLIPQRKASNLIRKF